MSESIQEHVQSGAATAVSQEDSTTNDPYQKLLNQIVDSGENKYQVLDEIGYGTFGVIFKCSKNADNKTVAIKFLKNEMRRNYVSNEREVRIGEILRSRNAHEHNIVRIYENFIHEDFRCLVFELLEQNLHTFLNEKQMALKHIRPIIKQVLSALNKFNEWNLIHCDLKPKNIMMVDSANQPWRVKLIDFGLSLNKRQVKAETLVQTLNYRAPEVLLGLLFDQAVDIWSLGCVMAELFLGCCLYPGDSKYYQMSYICHTQGLPTEDMLNSGLKTSDYFVRKDNPSTDWRLKTTEECITPGVEKEVNRKYVFKHLDEILHPDIHPIKTKTCRLAELRDRKEFVDLLKRMLEMDPKKRISHEEALKHSFITLTHFSRRKSSICYKESIQIMQNFQT